MPLRGDRILVKVEQITRKVGENNGNDVVVPIVVKMKRGIASWLALEEMATDDPLFEGTFASGANSGKKFIKRIGGFRFGSYTFIGKGKLAIPEFYYNEEDVWTETTKEVKSFSIGFPKGHSVNELIDWIKTWSRVDEIQRFRCPTGVSYPVNFGGGSEPEEG